MHRLSVLLPTLFFVGLCACTPGRDHVVTAQFTRTHLHLDLASPTPSESQHDRWLDRWWVEKTSRTLRGGAELSPVENPDRLLLESKEKLVDRFIQDPRFGDTLLDFSLMFIGFRQDLLRTPGEGSDSKQRPYLPYVFAHPQTIRASAEVLNNGDFFHLFDLHPDLYIEQLTRPNVGPDEPPENEKLTASQLRALHFKKLQLELDHLIALAEKVPVPRDEVCQQFMTLVGTYVFSDFLGLGSSIPFNFFFSADYYGKTYGICSGAQSAGYDFKAAFTDIQKKNDLLFQAILPFESEVYHPSSLTQFKQLDLRTIIPSFHYSVFTDFSVASVLANSSTNYNRKRAAYILKRFFCDDLTPVNVETPAVHAGGQHANSPSCFACHYKLDPMAGFFRYYGTQFNEYSQSPTIFFDDGASAKLADYIKAWQPGPDATHPDNIGYIRSIRDPSKNFYGSNLDDLFQFMKTAPEVRNCVVKRAYEYLVSPDQTVDGEYLDYLTQNFNDDIARSGSGVGIKNLFKSIVLSKTFSTPNPDRDNCDDHNPGQKPRTTAPCKVAAIISKNCVKCHQSTDDDGSLDLTQWQKLPDGSTGFLHLDSNRKPTSATATAQLMLDRIGDPNPEQRMPKGTEMPSQDRQQLYLWLNSVISPPRSSLNGEVK